MACTSAVLPALEFDECAPEIRYGEIGTIYFTRATAADVLTDATDDAEWTTRISNTAAIPGSGAAPIRQLTVIGQMPKPTRTETKISGGRKVNSAAERTITFKVDELSLDNLAAAAAVDAAGAVTWKTWFVAGGLLWGGNNGFNAQITLDPIIPEGSTEIMYIEGTLTWTGTQPETIVSPF